MTQNTVVSAGSTLGRVGTIATNVFREVIRDRILYLIGFYALGVNVSRTAFARNCCHY